MPIEQDVCHLMSATWWTQLANKETQYSSYIGHICSSSILPLKLNTLEERQVPRRGMERGNMEETRNSALHQHRSCESLAKPGEEEFSIG